MIFFCCGFPPIEEIWPELMLTMIVTTAGLLANRRIPPQMSLENAGTRMLRLLLKSRARFASSWWSTTVPDPVLSSNVVTNSIWGQWLFANGSTRLFPEFVMEDWIPEEDLYALSYPEMGFVLVCSELQVLSLQIHPSSQFLSSPFHHSLASAVGLTQSLVK
ncbi:PREDICTED: uncharacterized protein LOC106344485 [Brassica oleracea var. oleracea]|uniref:uncharacterized protein LOC106344485 n=1 Tax=Brassica oleracea var. oleracea TaxID=109376 RepID=UPI0006A7010A|nr:PREDICTED: uncharacterized protein LOC106344485 [Brassica oleracea var. oleracea]